MFCKGTKINLKLRLLYKEYVGVCLVRNFKNELGNVTFSRKSIEKGIENTGDQEGWWYQKRR